MSTRLLSRYAVLVFAATAALIFIDYGRAQEPAPYGSPIQLEAAGKVMEAATKKAQSNRWPVAIAIYDSTGHLVMFHRLDNTQLGSIEIALEKARSAVIYRRPTRFWEERLAEGGANVKLLKLPGVPFEGGLPIILDGKLIGGIGVSGVTSVQDGEIAAAGLAALTKE